MIIIENRRAIIWSNCQYDDKVSVFDLFTSKRAHFFPKREKNKTMELENVSA